MGKGKKTNGVPVQFFNTSIMMKKALSSGMITLATRRVCQDKFGPAPEPIESQGTSKGIGQPRKQDNTDIATRLIQPTKPQIGEHDVPLSHDSQKHSGNAIFERPSRPETGASTSRRQEMVGLSNAKSRLCQRRPLPPENSV